jgi:transcriptional regulator with XRE-family HTH domain
MGFSQEKLAHAVGATRQTVQRWETGTSPVLAKYRPPLARHLQVALTNVDDLLALDEEPVAGAPLATMTAELEDLLVSTHRDEQRLPVLRLLGHAYHAAGESAFDRLDFDTAAAFFHEAHSIGTELGDADMLTAAQTQLGDVARRQRRYSKALRIFGATDRHLGTASTLTQVRHHKTVARSHAELGDRAAFDRAIASAEELAQAISPEHHREGDHSPRGVRLERGQGLTLLGEPATALRIYDESKPPAFRSDRERGSFVIIRAQAVAAAGDLAEGVRLAIQGLELARRYESPRHVSRVQRMYDRLTSAWSPSEPALIELHNALAA